jgi:hypothetical protein
MARRRNDDCNARRGHRRAGFDPPSGAGIGNLDVNAKCRKIDMRAPIGIAKNLLVAKTYFNPLNTPFEPIQDTAAFATCP